MIILSNVYDFAGSTEFLYEMLGERDESINISHKKMPTFAEHRKFVNSNPYREWDIISTDVMVPVGYICLTKNNEIGVFGSI